MPRRQDRLLQRRDVGRINQGMIDRRDRILPQQIVLDRPLFAEVTLLRTHVAVGQLVPGLGELLGKIGEVGQEPLADRTIDGVDLQRDIAGHHHQRMRLARDMRVGGVRRGLVHRRPLQSARWAACLFPFELEQVFEVAVVPLGRVGRPAPLDAVGHRELARAGAFGIVPAEAHLLDWRHFRRRADTVGLHHAVALAEGVAARDQRHRLLVVHRHAGERDADVVRGRHWIAAGIGALGIHVD